MPHSDSNASELSHNEETNNCPIGTPTIELHKGRPLRLQVKVVVPVNDHPNFNFVGKLLGPKGNSLKWLQEYTQTKMAILGRGSMRDKEKEDELRGLSDPKYSHLNEELHVEITAFAPPPEAYIRIGNALHEVKRFLVPDYYDDIRQQQLRELGILNVEKKPKMCDNLRINDRTQDIDQTLIHDMPSNGGCAATHMFDSNGYDDSNCLPYNTNGNNNTDLSHYWEHKPTFKLSPRHNSNSNTHNNTNTYRDKPYARNSDINYH